MNETASQSPQTATPVTAVLFDFGQVLSKSPNPDAWQRLHGLIGGTDDLFHHSYWEPRHPYDRGDLDGPAYWQLVASTAGRPALSDAELDQLYLADVDLWTDLNQPMVDWAQRLQQRGIRTGILSNMPDQMALGICSRLDWLRAFDHHIWSHEHNLAKPELAIYQRSIAGLETPAAEILFIDDRADNIAAALTSGMQAIQYSTHDQFLADMEARNLTYLL